MAYILVNFNSQSECHQNWLSGSLWGEGKRRHEAIFKASLELKKKWLNLCYEELNLTDDDNVQIKLSEINDWFWYFSFDFLDIYVGECEDEEKPSDKILKFYVYEKED